MFEFKNKGKISNISSFIPKKKNNKRKIMKIRIMINNNKKLEI